MPARFRSFQPTTAVGGGGSAAAQIRDIVADEESTGPEQISVTLGSGTEAGDKVVLFHAATQSPLADINAPTSGTWSQIGTYSQLYSDSNMKCWHGDAAGGTQVITCNKGEFSNSVLIAVVLQGACTLAAGSVRHAGAQGDNVSSNHTAPALTLTDTDYLRLAAWASKGGDSPANADYLSPAGWSVGAEFFGYNVSMLAYKEDQATAQVATLDPTKATWTRFVGISSAWVAP
jgi:hypothetical protein